MTDSISAAREALLNYQQADMDGIMVLTSRQAIYEVTDHIDAQAAKLEEQAERIEELEAACEVVSNEFEGELWQSCRRLLQETYFDFSGTCGDGIQAADFESHMKETLSEFDRLQVKSETQAAKIAALVDALEYADRMCKLDLRDKTGWGNEFSQAVYDTAKRIEAALAAAKEKK